MVARPSKPCFKCGEEKPLSGFYAHKMMADGHLNKCKECAKADVLAYRWTNIEEIRKKDRRRGRDPSKKHMKLAAARRWSKKNKTKVRAQHTLRNAIKRGDITRAAECEECGGTRAIDGHHDDYNKPLEVRWLCRVCHKAWHKEHGEGLNAN